MRTIGRFLQVVALIILPLAMGLQLAGEISPGVMLQMLVAGVCIFGIGWILMTYR
jgi:multisubunit Na+/H+ antiporter MnhB subunit